MTVFDFIRNKLDILEVVTSYVDLKRAGTYFKGSCPFHTEKDASFTISPGRQIYFCFGCKKGGDVISFVAEVEQITQLEAAVYLSDKFAIELPEKLLSRAPTENTPIVHRNVYENAHKVIAIFCHTELLANTKAKDYLLSRGLTSETIARFGIGFFPSSKDKKKNLTKKLQQEGILLSDLEGIGFFNPSQGNAELSSPFEERIIFPIKDSLGRYIGFGGRVFLPSDDRAKYYNSRETELFLKKKTLFALFEAKIKGMKDRTFFLVEGYLDAILMHQHGYNNTVATLGTACSKEQLSIVSRMANNLFVMYDSDEAGVAAVLKLTELSFETPLQIKVVLLNKGMDPAQQLFEDALVLKNKVEEAIGIVEFFITTVSKNFFALSDGKKLESLEKILSIIEKMADPIKKYLTLQRIAHLTGVRYNMLHKQSTKKSLPPASEISNIKAPGQIKDAQKYSAEEVLFFTELLARQKGHNPETIISKDLYVLFSERICIFFKILDQASEDNNVQEIIAFLLAKVDQNEKEWLLEGFLWFDASFNIVGIKPLLECLFLQYAREKLRKCDRTTNLEQNIEERAKMNQLLAKIQAIGTLLKNKGEV